MSLTEQDLDNLSNLARITIAPEEKQKMLVDLQSILGYVSEINSVEGAILRGEEDVFNVVREDIITRETGSNTDAILANAPKVKNGFVEVEQVLK
ncbi:MAG: Asp-tRNA(Asn)/Glu-tRNA(Gln) amidotransferase subunit GatC [Candidatus Nomurabacteria bacterium]|nr:Asp-tRNA(Asn)/Glu-tRNA(Gln) amidotransferase subunit GatC [Candidatus Nomurabacteria bacterium]